MAFTSGAAGVAGNAVIDEVSTELMDTAATSIYVKCLTSSANTLLVNVPILHAATWLALEAGDGVVMRYGTDGDFVVNAKALDNTNDASVSWGVVGIA